MAPASLGHTEIAWNIRERLRARLPAGMGCCGPRQPIETVGGALREPDAFIACTAQHRTSVTIAAPVVVFEGLSPGRAHRQQDEIERVDEYESVPSILRYGLVEAESRGVRVFWRAPGERSWRAEALDAVGPLRLPEFGIDLGFDAIYEGAGFD